MEATRLSTSVRAGSAETFTEIVQQYQLPIIRYLYRLTGEYETAQDLAQDTFVQAYKKIRKTDSNLKLGAWLYRIATNNALQYHRRKKIIGFIPFENIRKSEPKGNGFHPRDLIEEMAIQETLEKIPYEQRVCIVLYYVEGFRCQEIAETIGISEAAVRKRISRGVNVFRQLYKEGDNK